MFKHLLIVLTALAFGAAAASAQAKLEIVGGETYDWGKVKPPKEGYLEAEIKMKNVGDRPLRITEVRPGCGCTKTDPDKTDLKPGEVSTMKVKLNISPANVGQMTKNINVSWADLEGNDAYKAFKTSNTPIPTGADTTVHPGYIWLKCDVQRAIMFSPSMYFSFSELKIGQEASSTMELTNNTDQEIVFSDWTTEGGLVCNQASRVALKPGEKLKVVVKVVPAAKGNYSGGVKVKTTNPENPELDLKAYGFVMESQSPVFQSTPPKAK